MNTLQKVASFTTATAGLVATVLAHSGDEVYGPGMMWGNGSFSHNFGHMMGYNMWGMGWWGFLPGLAIWILIILGIVYLFQKITENSQRNSGGSDE